MATGAQDWIVRSDIVLQALAELIVRPKFGSVFTSGGVAVLPLAGTVTIISLSGRGIIYGGYLAAIGANCDKEDAIFLVIDGENTAAISFENMMTWNLIKRDASRVDLLKYDLVNNHFIAEFFRDITFETSVLVKYSATNDLARLQYEFNYAII